MSSTTAIRPSGAEGPGWQDWYWRSACRKPSRWKIIKLR